MRVMLVTALLAALLTGAPAQQVDVYQRSVRAQRSRDYDVLRYRIRLNVHQDTRSFDGSTTITLRPLRDAFDVCVLDAETFIVSRVESVPDHRTLTFEQSATTLTVHLAHPSTYGHQVAFIVYYRAVDPHVDARAHGMPADYDLGLTFKPATETHPRLANTLSFPEGARHWFPCDDQPDDKAASDMIVTVDRGDAAISNGRLVATSEDPASGRRTFHWSEDNPFSTYLFVLVVGPYVKVADRLGTLPVDYWVYPNRVADARRSFHNTPRMIRFFNETFGYPYPWPKYDQIVLPHFGGGAESTSATVVGDGTLHDAKADPDFPSDPLVAHELAHQWWGDLVTARDWSQTWINEGFATYFEYVYTRHTRGEDEGALNLSEKIRSYLQEAHTRYQRPIAFTQWDVPNDNFDRHTYQKGAAVLDMLSWVMGEASFRGALSFFLHRHAFQPVDTHDLQDAISESTGQVLDWFFDEWIYKAGHPVFDVSYTWTPSPGAIRVRVRQVQPTSAVVPVFQMPVVIGVTTAAGTAHHKVWIRKADEQFDFASPDAPQMVRFDEGNHLLKEMTFEKATAELLFQLQHDDTMGRMWASDQLASRLQEPAVGAALRKAAVDDPFWAVRREIVQRLAASFAPGDVEFLKSMALDSASRVRAAALRALGDLHDRGLAAYFRERYERDASYLAEAEAVRALGKCGDASSIPFLKQVSQVPSPNGLIHAAAAEALKQLEQH